MNFNQIIMFVLKVLGLTLVAVIANIIAAMVVPLPEILMSGRDQLNLNTSIALILVNLVTASIIGYALHQSAWRGWKLVSAILIVTFGLQSLMTQIETFIFSSAFPSLTRSDIFHIALFGLVRMILVSPLAVWIFGRFKKAAKPELAWESPSLKSYGPMNLIWKLLLLSVIYPVLYFSFGAVVVWQSQAVREFYATWSQQPNALLPLLQVGRGLLWVLCGWPLFVMFKEKRDAVICSILFYSLLPTLQLLLPNNPLMPAAVRMAHFVEVSLSMAIFGFLAAVIMVKNTTPTRLTPRPHQNDEAGGKGAMKPPT